MPHIFVRHTKSFPLSFRLLPCRVPTALTPLLSDYNPGPQDRFKTFTLLKQKHISSSVWFCALLFHCSILPLAFRTQTYSRTREGDHHMRLSAHSLAHYSVPRASSLGLLLVPKVTLDFSYICLNNK